MSPAEQKADTIPPPAPPLGGVEVGSAIFRCARAAYVAHAEQRGLVPDWESLPMNETLAWAAAALASITHHEVTSLGESSK